jgi:NADH dehydrogenase
VILIAGGTGTLGTSVVRRLTDRGIPARVLTRDRHRASHLEHHGVEVVEGDVRDPASLPRAFQGVETVLSAVHEFAGPGHVSPRSVDEVGNANLVHAAAGAGADFVLMSVVGASAESRLELFRRKHAAEECLRRSGIPWTIVRATAFLELWIGILEKTAARSGRPVVFGRGDNPVNFVSVADVATLVERVLTDPSLRGETIEVGGPENLTFNQLATAVAQAHREEGKAGSPRHVPRPVLRAAASALGPLKPSVARQLRAAVALDVDDLRFDSDDVQRRFDLPSTSVQTVLAGSAGSVPH